MSREIKFRAWDKKRKRYAKVIQTTNQGWKGYRDKTYITNGIMCFSKWVLSRFIIEQYTGLTDKNGKEIYEGDIVKMPDWQVKPKYEKVRFAKLSCGFEPFVCGCFECIAPDGEEVEVIGNIHENPELLEDK